MLHIVLYITNVSSAYNDFSLSGTGNKKHRCIPVDIKECKSLGYNYTRPVDMYSSTSVNLKNGKKYIEQLSGIKLPRQMQNCVKSTIFLLCSVYSPICFNEYTKLIKPCKGVCNRLKQNCGHLLNLYGIELPEELKCDELPEHNSGVCIQPSALLTVDQANKQRHVKDTSPVTSNCNCKSFKSQKPRYKHFRKSAYVIEASITSRATLANGHTKVIVNVTKVLKEGKIHPKFGRMRLWSPTSCLCQKVEFDVKYILMGKENKKRLVVDNETFILPYQEYEHKVTKWNDRSKNRTGMKKQQKKKKRN